MTGLSRCDPKVRPACLVEAASWRLSHCVRVLSPAHAARAAQANGTGTTVGFGNTSCTMMLPSMATFNTSLPGYPGARPEGVTLTAARAQSLALNRNGASRPQAVASGSSWRSLATSASGTRRRAALRSSRPTAPAPSARSGPARAWCAPSTPSRALPPPPLSLQTLPPPRSALSSAFPSTPARTHPHTQITRGCMLYGILEVEAAFQLPLCARPSAARRRHLTRPRSLAPGRFPPALPQLRPSP